jgi:predicted NBD/HSP70 family sugar kinase
MFAHGAESRKDLCKRMEMSKASITRAVDRLLAAGLVEEGTKFSKSGRGRRAASLRVRPDIGYLLGADLEGMAVRACILDCSRQIVAGAKLAVGPHWSVRKIVEQWAALIDQVIRSSGVPRDRIVALGVGLPGVVSRDRLLTHTYLPPGRWADLDIGAALERFHLPVTAVNNVICVSEYERRMGVARGAPAFMSVLVRYGIGAAFYADGSFLHGEALFTGELGHTRLDARGPVCVCGRRGCLDVFASGRTWPGETFRTDGERRRELARRARYLGVAVANVLKMFHPPLVVLNGLYNQYRANVAPALAEVLEQELASLGISVPDAVFGEPVEFKSSIGAAFRAADEFLEPHISRNVLSPQGNAKQKGVNR